MDVHVSAFLEDVLAGCSRAYVDNVKKDAITKNSLDLSRILASQEVLHIIAFEAAWAAASIILGGGINIPTRLELRAFMALLEQGIAPLEAVQRAILALSPLRVLLPTAEMKAAMERAVQAYVKIVSVSNAKDGLPLSEIRIILWRRFLNLFGSNNTNNILSPPSGNQALLESHKKLRASDPILPLLEKWTKHTKHTDNAKNANDDSEYNNRVARCAESLGLPWRCPITGCELDHMYDDQVPLMTAMECLRSPLIRNVYLWRRDVGGVLSLADGSTKNVKAFQRLRKPKTIQDDEDAEEAKVLILAALPPGLYSTVLVPKEVSDSDAFKSIKSLVRDDTALWICGSDMTRDADAEADANAKRSLRMCRDLPISEAGTDWLGWLPPPDHLYGASHKAPFWALAVSEDMSKAFLRYQGRPMTPLTSATSVEVDGRGVLNYHQLLARYAHVRKLGSKVHITASSSASSSASNTKHIGAVLAIDTRENVWTALGVLATLDNLRCASWSVIVLCAESNVEWMRKAILPHAPHARIEAMPELTRIANDGAFDIEAYNDLMKSEALWNILKDEPRILTVQDDGAVLRPGLEDDADIMRQSYVGAPWQPHPILEAAGIVTDQGSQASQGSVGNGGVSLRNVEVMRRILRESGARLKGMFNGNAQPLPEDVFFASGLTKNEVCPFEVARRFAFEQIFAGGCYAFHKPWAYLPPAVYVPEFQSIVKEATERK